MDSTEIEIRIKRYEAQLSESKCSEDMDWIQCQLDNLRFRLHLVNLKRRAYEIKDKPTDMELLKKHLTINF